MNTQVPLEYCFLWIDRWYLCMDKPAWASWVQAIGSIGAILGAIAIAYFQNRQQFRLFERQARIEARRLHSISAQAMADEMAKAAADKQFEDQKRAAQYRRVSRASVEVISMLSRGLYVHVHMDKPRLDVDEISDVRARLRAIEDDVLPAELIATIHELREIIGVAAVQQHRWSGQSAAEVELGNLLKLANKVSSDANKQMENFIKDHRDAYRQIDSP